MRELRSSQRWTLGSTAGQYRNDDSNDRCGSYAAKKPSVDIYALEIREQKRTLRDRNTPEKKQSLNLQI